MSPKVSNRTAKDGLFGIDLEAVRAALKEMSDAERRIPPGGWILPSAFLGAVILVIAVIAVLMAGT